MIDPEEARREMEENYKAMKEAEKRPRWNTEDRWHILCSRCEEEFSGHYGGFRYEDQAITHAKRAGWRLIGEETLCPDCVERVESDAEVEAAVDSSEPYPGEFEEPSE